MNDYRSDNSGLNMIYILTCLCICLPAQVLSQLDGFDQFFVKFGSQQFSQPNTQSYTPTQYQPPPAPQYQPPPVPSLGSRYQSSEGSSIDSHQAALQSHALHRKQLAQVIESHNKVVSGKQSEILDTGTPNYGKYDKKPYKKKKAYKKFNFSKYLQQETLKQSEKAVLNDIQEEVVENLQLIRLLAEQIRKLDYEAYKVFSKWTSPPHHLTFVCYAKYGLPNTFS